MPYKKNNWIWLYYTVLIILALTVLYFTSVKIKPSFLINSDESKITINLPFQGEDPNFKNTNQFYKIIIDSKINQSAKFNIAVDDTIEKIAINNALLDIKPLTKAYKKSSLDNWRPGYYFILPLKSGINTIDIKSRNTDCCGFGIKIKQKPFFWIWMLLLISIGLPLAHLCTILIKIIFKKISDGKK